MKSIDLLKCRSVSTITLRTKSNESSSWKYNADNCLPPMLNFHYISVLYSTAGYDPPIKVFKQVFHSVKQAVERTV